MQTVNHKNVGVQCAFLQSHETIPLYGYALGTASLLALASIAALAAPTLVTGVLAGMLDKATGWENCRRNTPNCWKYSLPMVLAWSSRLDEGRLLHIHARPFSILSRAHMLACTRMWKSCACCTELAQVKSDIASGALVRGIVDLDYTRTCVS